MSADPRDAGGYTGEGFLSRWSRRKLLDGGQAKAEAERPEAVRGTPPVPSDAPTLDEAADDRPRCPETGELIDEEHVASLPRIEDIRPGDDLSGFMRRGVPEALRRQALRTMWTTDPAIRDYVSPALDYAHDYNTPGAVVGFEPLSESELESARAMVGRMFSAPSEAQKAVSVPTAEAVSEADPGGPAQIDSSLDRDMESQPDSGRPPSAVRLVDAAAQQGPAVAPGQIVLEGGSSGVDDGADPEVCQDPPRLEPAPAMLQRSSNAVVEGLRPAGEGTSQPISTARRRRGGGATPI